MCGLNISQTNGGNDHNAHYLRGGGGGGGGGGRFVHILCILMGFRPKNEPNDPYGYQNDPRILLIPIWSNP